MEPSALARDLAAIRGRGPCTDAERRAARRLVSELRRAGWAPRTETVWVRPGWPGVWLVYALLGVAGTVVSVDHPAVALGILAVATLSALAELSGRVRLLSLLAPKRATQNVIATPPERRAPTPPLWSGEEGAAGSAEATRAPKAVHLIVTAGYDAARTLPPTTRALGGGYALLRRALRGRLASPLGLLGAMLVLLTVLAGVRLGGAEGVALGAVQLVPTVACILATALLAEVAFAEFHAGANAHASAAAAALGVAAALDRAPPRHLTVEVVLAGAADAGSLGMRAHVRARRKQLRREEVAVVHLEPAGAGNPAFWLTDGPLLGASFHPQLVRLARAAAEAERHLGARAHRGHGLTGALAAKRAARWPAIAIGALDDRGEAPEPHAGAATEGDEAPAKARSEAAGASAPPKPLGQGAAEGGEAPPTPEVDPASLRGTVELAVAVIRGLDRELGAGR